MTPPHSRPFRPADGCAGHGASQPVGGTERAELPLGEAQAIAREIVGAVEWMGQGTQGWCVCPGIARHTKANAKTDCKVVVEPVAVGGGTLAPGVYCFHGSCESEVRAASFQLRSSLGKRRVAGGGRALQASPARLPVRPPEPDFDPAKLAAIAARRPDVDEDFLAARSRKAVDNRTCASFLHELYRPGECVVIFDVFKSQGQAVWTCPAPPYNALTLEHFRRGRKHGVWFLANPVTGKYALTDTGTLSRRSRGNVTDWRYLVIESDEADPAHWLAALAQMPLPISAIYTSGGRSIHALVRVDARSKEDWDAQVAALKRPLRILGADKNNFSAVRLTRLPCCERVETGGMQRLLYLNGSPDGTPICEQRKL